MEKSSKLLNQFLANSKNDEPSVLGSRTWCNKFAESENMLVSAVDGMSNFGTASNLHEM
jgi:hypothetical protein